MKKHLLFLPALMLMTAVSITSCNKDDDDEPSKSVNDYLTAGNWKTTAMTISPGINFGGVTVTDFFAQMPACSKDDLIKFNSDGTITDDEGATKCSVNDPQTSNDGSWVLSADKKSITISYPNEIPFTVNIVSINDTQFVGTYTLEEDFGSGLLTYTITITMIH